MHRNHTVYIESQKLFKNHNSKNHSSLFFQSQRQHKKLSINIHAHKINEISKLKKLELSHSPKSPRTKFNYEDNYTAATSLSVDSNYLNRNKNNINKLLKLSETNILEHAARRVDLFFYLLIAYYNSHIIPQEGWTKLQHGRGRQLDDKSVITQACHSSFIPALIDSTLYKDIPVKSFHDRNLNTKDSIICNTHFMDSLNSTMELPKFVNEFDTELETVYDCRLNSLKILAAVSMGEIDPITGLQRFLIMMQETFKIMQNDKRFYKPIFEAPPVLTKDESIDLKSVLLSLVKKGTFKNKWNDDTQKINDIYIFMLLRLNPHEIKMCNESDKSKTTVIQNKIKELSQEIKETPSSRAYSLR